VVPKNRITITTTIATKREIQKNFKKTKSRASATAPPLTPKKKDLNQTRRSQVALYYYIY
jgi:hypothetical protein